MAWVRARQMQMLLGHIDRLPEPDRQNVCAKISPADVIRSQSATAFEWLPMRIGTTIARAVIEVLGPERSRTFFNQQFSATLDNAILGSLFLAVKSRLPPDPRAGIRWIARGHDLLFKEAGKLTAHASSSSPEVLLVLAELPKELVTDRMWLLRYAWSIEGALRKLWSVKLDCELVENLPEEGIARFRITWPV